MPRHALAVDGFAQDSPQIREACASADLAGLRREFGRLERDEYAPLGTNRFRRYGNGIVLPWREDGALQWLPALKDESGNERAGYSQGTHNPDHSDIRYFPALSDEVKRNPALLQLIREDFSLTFWGQAGQQLPIYFGVHFIKLVSRNSGELGISSPNCFHQDGEPFTFAHLIYRSPNMEGGVNYIGQTALRDVNFENAAVGQILAEFTLTEPFDTFAVHDPKVTHFVSPIRKLDDHSTDLCERCIVLIDFSPMIQQI